jgi:hypothetical protein
VDSNIGFNKTNALLDVKFDYSIDLSNLNSPTAELTITHKNNARNDIPCIQWGLKSNGTYENFMNRCYWDYLRVYTLDNTKLLLSTPHAIPAEWMIKKESVPAKIDQLNEKIQGIQGFGTLLVVRGGQSLETSFIFSLPQRVLDRSQDDKLITYHLKFQKQPGTVAIPLNLKIHLPVGAKIINTATGNQIGGDWYLNTNLEQDVKIDVTFKTP